MSTRILCSILTLTLLACGDADNGAKKQSEDLEVPTRYVFASRFGDGSSVSYSGQVLRHVLSQELKKHIGGLTGRIDGAQLSPDLGDVAEELSFYYAFDGATAGEEPHTLTLTPAALQTTLGELSTSAQLKNKLAGNDATGQHKTWTEEFVGWAGAPSPEGLLLSWFDEIDERSYARADGQSEPFVGACATALPVHVTPAGHNLQELVQKFLDGAVTFSQATDDYLDDDLADSGLNVANDSADEGQLYSPLEHHWDEAFGYFGAARDYNDYTDLEIEAKSGRDDYKSGYHDTNGDSAIDLKSEYNFGHSQNAAKRDNGSLAAAKTDFTKTIFDAFLRGRAIISSADGNLSTEQMTELKAQRDIIVLNWERVLAATVLHYINEVVRDMATFGDCGAYSFLDHAKHWSEMKGFALVLQFNPRSPLSDVDFATLHEKMGDAPALPGDGSAAAYKTGLLEARALLAGAYDFAAANVGDDNGENGW